MLTDRERVILRFEHDFRGPAELKDWEIRKLFNWTPYRYYQVLRALALRQEAYDYAPYTVDKIRAAIRRARNTHWSAA